MIQICGPLHRFENRWRSRMGPQAGVKWNKAWARRRPDVRPDSVPRMPTRQPTGEPLLRVVRCPLATSIDLMARREGRLMAMSHALPVKPRLIGTTLAVRLGMLAMRAGVSLLRHRITGVGRSSTLTIREHDTALSEYRLGQGIETILIQEWGKAHPAGAIAWQAIRSIAATEWTASSRRSVGRSRAAWSSGGSRASQLPFEREH
jgi:hypothetical protein